MDSAYSNGPTTDQKLVVRGRIVAAERIYLKTYGELELPVESYLTGTGNDAASKVELESAAGVTLTGRVNAVTFIVTDAENIITSIYSGRVLNYVGDTLSFNGDDLVLKVDGDIDLSNVTVSGDIDIEASGTITVSSLSADGGVVKLESTVGDVIVHSLGVSSSTGVILKAAETVEVKSSAAEFELNASGTSLSVEAKSILIEGDVNAGSTIDLNAGEDLTIDGNVTAGSDINTDAETDLTINGTLEAAGNILLRAHSPETSPEPEDITRLQITGAVTASGAVTITSNIGFVSITGTVTAGSDLDITAGSGIDQSLESTASAVNLTSGKGAIVIAGTITAAKSIELTAESTLEINGTVTAGTEVIMDVATTLLVGATGTVIATNDQIIVDAGEAIKIDGTLQAQTMIDLYTEASLTLSATAVLSGLTGSAAEFIRLDAFKELVEVADSTVNAETELRITESIANLKWDVHGSTTWMHVEDNDSLRTIIAQW